MEIGWALTLSRPVANTLGPLYPQEQVAVYLHSQAATQAHEKFRLSFAAADFFQLSTAHIHK